MGQKKFCKREKKSSSSVTDSNWDLMLRKTYLENLFDYCVRVVYVMLINYNVLLKL